VPLQKEDFVIAGSILLHEYAAVLLGERLRKEGPWRQAGDAKNGAGIFIGKKGHWPSRCDRRQYFSPRRTSIQLLFLRKSINLYGEASSRPCPLKRRDRVDEKGVEIVRISGASGAIDPGLFIL